MPETNNPGVDTGWTSTIGSDRPVPLFAHGFGGSIADTRPFATGVHGTRGFMHFRGHGGRPSPGPGWTYAELADELGDALGRIGATRALGVSMGAGALARQLSRQPRSLEKAVFVLPAALDGRHGELQDRLADRARLIRGLVDAGDESAVIDELKSREPAEVRSIPAAESWLTRRARTIIATDQRDGLTLPTEIAVPDASALAAVSARVLVLTQQGDAAHPESVARDYAAAFPDARLEVLPAGSILWLGRKRIREIITEFLND